ncbi:hypothetical protein EON79_14130 [bacterium]|nr:MAG: hypothetical protein EON79_14130 [bacterium]
MNTDTLQATALLVTGDSGVGGLPFGDILNIGADAVTVETVAAIFWASATSPGPGREAKEIKGLPVVDSLGTTIGNVSEIELSGDRVNALNLHAGGLFGIGGNSFVVPVRSVRSIGPKLVTVEAAVETPQVAV